jgi:hypothetical protein
MAERWPDIKAAAVDALRDKPVIGKTQAQLRAAVFHALDST